MKGIHSDKKRFFLALVIFLVLLAFYPFQKSHPIRYV